MQTQVYNLCHTQRISTIYHVYTYAYGSCTMNSIKYMYMWCCIEPCMHISICIWIMCNAHAYQQYHVTLGLIGIFLLQMSISHLISFLVFFSLSLMVAPSHMCTCIMQVYKAKLRVSGETVAVKVQRPGVLSTISLDLYIIRSLAMGISKLPNQQDSSDFLMFLDQWAEHLFQELNYTIEVLFLFLFFSKNMLT